jgi:hypothetical protein
MLVLLLREAGRMAIYQPCPAHGKHTLIESTDLSGEELRNRQEKAPSLRNASRGSEAFGVPEGLPFKEGVGGGLSRLEVANRLTFLAGGYGRIVFSEIDCDLTNRPTP